MILAIVLYLWSTSTSTLAAGGDLMKGNVQHAAYLDEPHRNMVINTTPYGTARTGEDSRPSLRHRNLQTPLKAYTFPECIEQKLSVEDCRDWIEAQIENAGGHEVGYVQVKIHVPRSSEELAESYWMVEVPANIKGEMACNRNEGKTFYPYLWDDPIFTDGEQAAPIQDLDCLGLTAADCCLKVWEYGKTLTTSGGYDGNGRCLSCFAHLEPLVPVLIDGEVKYQDYILNSSRDPASCESSLYGDEDFHFLQESNPSNDAINVLSSFRESPLCGGFVDLLHSLYQVAVLLPILNEKIGQLSCIVCYGHSDKGFDDPAVVQLIDDILLLLEQGRSSVLPNPEKCIVIYADNSGTVKKIPALGGGIEDNGPAIPDDRQSCYFSGNEYYEQLLCDEATSFCQGPFYPRCEQEPRLRFIPPFPLHGVCVAFGLDCQTNDDCTSDDYYCSGGTCKPRMPEGTCYCGVDTCASGLTCGRGYVIMTFDATFYESYGRGFQFQEMTSSTVCLRPCTESGDCRSNELCNRVGSCQVSAGLGQLRDNHYDCFEDDDCYLDASHVCDFYAGKYGRCRDKEGNPVS